MTWTGHPPVDPSEVEAAERRFEALHEELGRELVKRPVIKHSQALSNRHGATVLIADEGQQTTSAYKIRGATNCVLGLREEGRLGGGVLASSAGNHGRGVAEACRLLGVAATIVTPTNSPERKIDFMRAAGAEVVGFGLDYDRAFAHALELQRERPSLVFVHPYEDRRVVAGQATLIKQALEEIGALDLVLCPVGGGGLFTGTATWLQHSSPDTRLVAVEPEQAAALRRSVEAGERIVLSEVRTIADGVAVRKVGRPIFELYRRSPFPVMTVGEPQIDSAIHRLYNENILAEGAGALSVAALSSLGEELAGKTVLCLMTGANIDHRQINDVFRRAELFEGTSLELFLDLPHIPGRLNAIARVCAAYDANVTRFHFDEHVNVPVNGMVYDVPIGLRLSDPASGPRIVEELVAAGFGVRVRYTGSSGVREAGPRTAPDAAATPLLRKGLGNL